MSLPNTRRTDSRRTVFHTVLLFLVLGILTIAMVFALKASLTGSLL